MIYRALPRDHTLSQYFEDVAQGILLVAVVFPQASSAASPDVSRRPYPPWCRAAVTTRASAAGATTSGAALRAVLSGRCRRLWRGRRGGGDGGLGLDRGDHVRDGGDFFNDSNGCRR